jgi:hypothetical protein
LNEESLIPKVFYAILNPVMFIHGERPLYYKIFLPVILLLVVSCSPEQPAGRPTVDTTQRWLNAKCPPSEVCAPENEVERVGRAYLTAILSRDCDEAASYWAQAMQTEAVKNCKQGIILPDEVMGRCQLTEYEIEKAIIEDTTMGKSINYSGYFLYSCEDADNGFQTENLKLFLREPAGEWEITGMEG